MVKTAALISTIILFGLIIFQILLALGFPLGRAAFGGTHEVLPSNLRLASILSGLIYSLAIIFVLEKAGVISIVNSPTLTAYALWILFGIFALSTLAQLASRSELEKLIMTPLALTLTIAFFIVARTNNK